MPGFPSLIRGSKARFMLKATPNQFLVPNGAEAASNYDSFRLSDGALNFVLSPIPGQRPILPRTA